MDKNTAEDMKYYTNKNASYLKDGELCLTNNNVDIYVQIFAYING
jgi:hypothetical protein